MNIEEQLASAARRFAESGGTPVTPRLAATVVLLRPPLDVFLLRRAPSMAFAAGMHVFPGGAVDPRDARTDPPAAPPQEPADFSRPPSYWADRLGLPEETAQAVVYAAVREVFEETGVLLAGPGEIDTSTPEWESAREAVERREIGFAELLAEHRLHLRADLLGPWSRWITPEFEPRRYDTYFFVAALPSGQISRHATGEADQALWTPVAQTADLTMLPPTRVTLTQLAAHGSVPAVLEAARETDAATPVQPRFDGARLVY